MTRVDFAPQDVNLLVQSLLLIVRPNAVGNEPAQAGRSSPRGSVDNDLKLQRREKAVLLMYETGVLGAVEVAHVQLFLAQGVSVRQFGCSSVCLFDNSNNI